MVQSQTMVDREKPGISLQPRDLALLCGLFESRVMTLAHAATLYFPDTKEMAKKRVQKLKAAGLIRERPRHVGGKSVLFLSRKALDLLNDKGCFSHFPQIGLAELNRRAQVSESKLRHELEVMDVKTAIVSAVQETSNYRVADFTTWPALSQFNACRPNGELVDVYPDGFLRVEEKEADGGLSEHTFFLEVDRSTESLNVVAEKCHCYGDYYRSGGFAVGKGDSAGQFREYPFRVLLVCKSEQRRDNIAGRLLLNSPPIKTQVIVMTSSEVASMSLRILGGA